MLLVSIGAAGAESLKDYEGHWAQTSIQRWLDKGLLKGFEDGAVKPDQTITRAEFLAIINRSFDINDIVDESDVKKISFSDLSPTNWAYAEVEKAVTVGYIQGYNNQVRPNAPISRQEAAVIISKLMYFEMPQNQVETLAGFSDGGEVANWAKGQVAALLNSGMMKGYPDGTFRPKRSMTRAEVITLLNDFVLIPPSVFSSMGVFGGSSEESRLNYGDVTITNSGVTLQNMNITGNLVLSEGVETGDVALINVTVHGTTTVNGGGGDSIHFINSNLGEVIVNKAGGSVRLVAEGSTRVKQVTAQTAVTLEETEVSGDGFAIITVNKDLSASGPLILSGSLNAVNINAKTTVKLTKGSVGVLSIGTNAGNTIVELGAGTTVTKAEVDALIKVIGSGQVENAVLNEGAKGSSFERKPITTDGSQKDSLIITGAAATPTPIVTIGGGGGGGGSVVTPTPTSSAPVKDIPLLKASIISSPDTSVTNAVYLSFDYSEIPESIIRSSGNASYYITSSPITEKDLRWELYNQKAIMTMTTTPYLNNPIYQMTVPAYYAGTGGNKYVTVVFRGKDGAVGYYTQQVEMHPSLTSLSGNFMKLTSGVTIEQDKQNIDGSANYSDIVDVRDVFSLYTEVAYYTITPKYVSNSVVNREVGKILSSSLRLYNQDRIRVVEAYTQSAPGLPLAVELMNNTKTYNEQEYTLVFYDKTLKAISYYEGSVHLSDDLALEAAEKKVDEIEGSSATALQSESSILRASKAYSLLDNSLKAKFSQDRKDKLTKALSDLEAMKQSGPLGSSLPLVATDITKMYQEFNGTTLGAYNSDFPYSLQAEVSMLSFYITDHPITLDDLKKTSGTGTQAYSELAYLQKLDKKGDYYVTVVYYGNNMQPVRYATKQISFNPLTPIWDRSAVQIKDGITLLREYSNGLRMEYISFTEYLKDHPEAVYFTATTNSTLAATNQSFTPESAVQQINRYQLTSKSLYHQILLDRDEVLNGHPENYIIIFYDKDFKPVHYYIGTLTD